MIQDLQQIHKHIKEGASLLEFVPGMHDLRRQLHVSQKLFGRETQKRQLEECFDQVSKGLISTVLVLVQGVSGVCLSSFISFLFVINMYYD